MKTIWKWSLFVTVLLYFWFVLPYCIFYFVVERQSFAREITRTQIMGIERFEKTLTALMNHPES